MLQQVFDAIAAFFRGASQLFGLWVGSTSDAPSIIRWFAFAVFFVAALGLAQTLINSLVPMLDRSPARVAAGIVNSGFGRLFIALAFALVFASIGVSLVTPLFGK
jgi:hypothetical protein